MHIDEFDHLTATAARSDVAVWAAVPTWVDAVVAGRPYGSVRALAAHAEELAARWGRTELDAALAHHPRIGEKPAGTGAEAAASRREQASMAHAGTDVESRMAAGNRAYEKRFGRVFLVRAAGRTPAEMLAELTRRLENDEPTEVAEACDQLAQIALLRLRATVSDTPEASEEHP
ncbi:2-oxo-4-hydroxy-4-carboxy-5-ureidoimidazoline decarboxylase [Isoptericola sp. CG 20/1183]|uniref:2-oxo-4-hydroxy-4-carboxy-5-ureidoimidazoline decarboxylase n=1 Tax=Isoptericola halotolerans TaxID=300560 RepID=A0ABX5EFU3_9MICO|nr:MULTISPECIES: 2-oxo-4-hydroxy-4-carboxy-5-ureidoimidazoline decarboxylase [Isoptericola]PRZ07636.1 2-oxo-4-hydroxy-4-carboxy-5-ureidoimidazoline decarboxylase [Isoptericola halotolerans]PRZ08005.1 2-oxo-4-hydroxy-4-carboxy-5-ureidoimidazoline decarboxylase [Isoptericola sp. CG 20/1183]